MKLINTTNIDSEFLRRMVWWCCKQLDMPSTEVERITFRNKFAGSSGHCYFESGVIVVSIHRGVVKWSTSVDERGKIVATIQCASSRDWRDTRKFDSYDDANKFVDRINDNRMNELVRVTAHELAHRKLYLDGRLTRKSRRYGTTRGGGSEQQTIWHETQVLSRFKENRYCLVAEWKTPVYSRQQAVSVTVRERRAQKVATALDRWQRKLKLATTKVKHYKKRLAYYSKPIRRSVS